MEWRKQAENEAADRRRQVEEEEAKSQKRLRKKQLIFTRSKRLS
jgi:hypothetical protein